MSLLSDWQEIEGEVVQSTQSLSISECSLRMQNSRLPKLPIKRRRRQQQLLQLQPQLQWLPPPPPPLLQKRIREGFHASPVAHSAVKGVSRSNEITKQWHVFYDSVSLMKSPACRDWQSSGDHLIMNAAYWKWSRGVGRHSPQDFCCGWLFGDESRCFLKAISRLWSYRRPLGTRYIGTSEMVWVGDVCCICICDLIVTRTKPGLILLQMSFYLQFVVV